MPKRRKFPIPGFLKNKGVSQDAYEKWLYRRGADHLKRDRKRGNRSCTGSRYRIAIHDAVKASKGFDRYTGEKLDWNLISTFRNDQARVLGRQYKKRFALLPTVDHLSDGRKGGEFAICGWRTNDAKSDLTEDEFKDLCGRVYKFLRVQRRGRRADSL